MISTTLTRLTDRERAKSLAKPLNLDTLVPALNCNSKRVITGPGWTATTWAAIPKSTRCCSRSLDKLSSSAMLYPVWAFTFPAWASKSSGGNPCSSILGSGICRGFVGRATVIDGASSLTSSTLISAADAFLSPTGSARVGVAAETGSMRHFGNCHMVMR